MIKLRSTLRSLLRSPGFSTVSTLTLALGIAAAAAVFALVDGVLLQQLPYPNARRVVQIDHALPGLDLKSVGISHRLFSLYAAESRAIDRIALYTSGDVTLRGEGLPQRLAATRVSPSIFDVLGVSPVLGRGFASEDAKPGGAEPVVILGHRLFEERYGGDASILGSALVIDSVPHSIVGVMPDGFAFPEPKIALWRPRTMDPDLSLGSFGDRAVGRLAQGASIATERPTAQGWIWCSAPLVFNDCCPRCGVGWIDLDSEARGAWTLVGSRDDRRRRPCE